MIKCSKCGFEFDEGIFCPMCGTKNEPLIQEDADAIKSADASDVSPTQQNDDSSEKPSEDTTAVSIKEQVEIQEEKVEVKSGHAAENHIDISQKPQPNVVIGPQHSGLSIVALILSAIPFTFLFGIIVAIIDLFKSREKTKKHICSYISFAVAAIWLSITCVLVFGGNSDNSKVVSNETVTNSDETTDSSQKEVSSKKSEKENSKTKENEPERIENNNDDDIQIEENYKQFKYDESGTSYKKSMENNGVFITYDDAVNEVIPPGRFVSCDVKIGQKVDVSTTSEPIYYAVTGELQGDGESEPEFLALGDFNNKYFFILDKRLDGEPFIEDSYAHIYGAYSGFKRFTFGNGEKKLIPIITVCYTSDSGDQSADANEEYICEYTGSKLLGTSDYNSIRDKYEDQISSFPGGRGLAQMMINEIYARHGMMYKDEGLSNYFNSKSWYNGKTYEMSDIEAELNQIEKDNVIFLAEKGKLEKGLSGDYICEYADTKLLGTSDFNSIRDKYENKMDSFPGGRGLAQMMINEIYARHGMMFKDAGLSNYFNSKSWYNGRTYEMSEIEAELNQIEKDNVIFLTNKK